MGNSNGKPVVLTDEVNLNHFRLLRVVGKGAFGKVRIVERKDSGLTFALKYIRKDEVVRSESVRNIIRERRMLQHLNHPFLCNLRYSFQDMEYLYIVVDLMNGGDLRFHITRKTFTEEAVRFWIAELGCALRYVHGQRIVHRDVKPDNVLLDSQGHVHLADFNVASDFKPGKPLTSKSGTLAYLAPEVYTGKGYSSEVDWWSLGVLFYECIYNKRPFEGNNHEQLALSIVKAEPPFPRTNPPVSNPCLHAISSLLEKNKTLRIGASGFETFTDNPFFREIDFEALEAKQIEPVFCPSSDKTNFDATYDLEELLLEEAPLEARARRQKPRAELRDDATQQEIRADELHRMVETMFEPFNYTTLPDYRPPVTETNTSDEQTTSKPRSSHRGKGDKAPHTRPERDGRSEKDWPLVDSANQRGLPISRSQTPGSATHTRSSAHSADGSPPLPHAVIASNFGAAVSTSSLVDNNSPVAVHAAPDPAAAIPPIPPIPRDDPLSPTSNSPGSRAGVTGRQRSATRSTSIGGPANEEGQSHKKSDKPAGMLGFLSRKKGRDRSPKPLKEKERGVLGKEGARVVVRS